MIFPNTARELHPNVDESTDSPFTLFLSKDGFLANEVDSLVPSEIGIIQTIESDPIFATIVDLLSYERRFVDLLQIVQNQVLPLSNQSRFMLIYNTLNETHQAVFQAHQRLLAKIEQGIREHDINAFMETLISNNELLEAHKQYNICIKDVWPLDNAFSFSYSDKFYSLLDNMTIEQAFHLTVFWQIKVSSFSRKMAAQLGNEGLAKFGKILIEFTESIDSIPALEQVSKLFVLPPYPIIKNGRRFIRLGNAFKQCRKTNSERTILLFSDVFIYAQPKGGYLLVPSFYWLVHLRAAISPWNEENALALYAPKKSFILRFKSQVECDQWFKLLTNAITNARANEESFEFVEEAPIWEPDYIWTCCQICKKPYSVFRRRHHCRRCGCVACNSCLKNRVVMSNIGEKPVRVCEACHLSLQDLIIKGDKIESKFAEEEEMSGDEEDQAELPKENDAILEDPEK